MKKISRIVIFSLFVSLVINAGCSVYYNTFYNAKKSFNEAESERKDEKHSRINSGLYKKAIEKSLKVTENHPKSKYYDDALFILGVSYFFTKEYSKAERRFREIISEFPDSKFYKQSEVYLAKTKLELEEMEEANILFRRIFESDFNREYKAEAAISLGKYYFDEGDFEESRRYFQAVRDSLGQKSQQREAQTYIADGYYELFKFKDALGAYLQVLGLEPTKGDKYHALYQAAECSFRMQRINDGMDYLEELADDELYFDSLPSLKLKMAEGYEYDGDLIMAEVLYDEVATTASNRKISGQAYYRLGLIYQFDYDDLPEAKDYYDDAAEKSRNTDAGQEALERSTAIGKLEQFKEAVKIDTAATQDVLDEAAYTQYLLAELYWFELNKPDSAIVELENLIKEFPDAYDRPKAMIALSEMYREQQDNSKKADSLLKALLKEHPHSDYVPEALDQLGLRGTSADTGYAEVYFRHGEDNLLEGKIDSAVADFRYVVDHFPDSKYFLHAKFNVTYAREIYKSPGDSSLIKEYQELIDSFPGTEYAQMAQQRINIKPSRNIPMAGTQEGDTTALPGDSSLRLSDLLPQDTAEGYNYYDYETQLYIRPNGDTIVQIDEDPTETIEPFVFPTEHYNMQEEAFYLNFQILLDFSGKVVDYELKNPSVYEEINRRAERAVASMTFDPIDVSNLVTQYDLKEAPEQSGHWFVYKFLVKKPDFLR